MMNGWSGVAELRRFSEGTCNSLQYLGVL